MLTIYSKTRDWGFDPALPDLIPMSDPGGCTLQRPPTASEVVEWLKDDGDFDALRRAIVRKVKDNPLNVNSPHPLPKGCDFVTL